jgi:sodium/proline symporter
MAILIFFIFYIAGNLKAGMITFEQCFYMPGIFALIIIAVLCAAYTAGGGYLSTIYTGVLQAILMMVFAILMPVAAFVRAGGIASIVSAIEPAKLEIFGGEIWSWGGGLGAIALGSLMANWWFGYFGQPHALVRYMGIKKPGEVSHAILVSGIFMTIISMGGILLGFAGMALEPGLENPDFLTPTLINTLLPPWLGGLMVAGIMAAIMSSVAAFLQVSSISISEDLIPSFKSISNKKRIWTGRIVVIAVTLIASGVAYLSPEISHWVMTYGWMGLAATFGPIILLSLYWKGLNKWGAISGIATGLVITVIWICYLQWICIATGPAFISSLIAILIVSRLTGGPAKEWKAQVTKEMQDINRPLKE